MESRHYLKLLLAGSSLLIVFAVLVIAVLAFEVWMLADLIKNESIPIEEKLLWAIGMFLVHPLVAIAYYFVSRRRHSGKK